MSRICCFAAATVILATAAPAYADSDGQEHLDDARSLYLAGHWEAADEAFQNAYEHIEEGTKVHAATALEWGTLHWEMGSYDQAAEHVRTALEVARELELDETTGELLSTLGHIQASRGELSSAEHTLNTCIQITGELGDDVHRALCRLNRRTVRTLRGTDPGSESEYRADLETLGRADSALSVATSLAQTSRLYRDTQDYERASELLGEAHQIYRETGNVPATTRNRLRKAQLMHHRGQYEKARPMLDGLRQRFEEMKSRPMVVHTLALKAEDALQQGHLKEGLSHYQRGLSIAEDIENPQLIGRVHLAICELNIDRSHDHCEQASEVFATSEMAFLEIRARTALARTEQSRNQYEDARRNYRTAIEQLEQTADTDAGPHAVSRALQYANLCQVETELQASQALDTCKEAIDAFDRVDEAARDEHHDVMAAAIHSAGRSAAEAQEYDDAVDYLSDAADHYEQRDHPRHQVIAADILLRKGAIEAGIQSKRSQAPKTFERGLELTSDLDADDATERADTRISLQTQLAQYYLDEQHWTDAIDHLESLVDTAEAHDDSQSAAWAWRGLSNAYLQTDRTDDAVDALENGRRRAEEAGDDNLVDTFDEYLERFDN